VDDIRLIPYGQGPALLAASFRVDRPSGTFYVTGGTGLSAVVVEALTPFAATVVRGVR
jgi:hypothetical protein